MTSLALKCAPGRVSLVPECIVMKETTFRQEIVSTRPESLKTSESFIVVLDGRTLVTVVIMKKISRKSCLRQVLPPPSSTGRSSSFRSWTSGMVASTWRSMQAPDGANPVARSQGHGPTSTCGQAALQNGAEGGQTCQVLAETTLRSSISPSRACFCRGHSGFICVG